MDKKQEFIDLYTYHITRPGAAALLAWMENETEFFTAPASSKHHGAERGGLVVHSLNVYRRLREIALREIVMDTPADLWPEVEESLAIMGLLHDLCKNDVYHPEMKRRRDPTTGQWGDVQEYTFRDPFPFGHGEKSVYLITQHMKLTPDEALAIRWHMGAFDDAAKGGGKALNAAMDMTPWVWRLHQADMCATHEDEREEPTG